jgi:hypothetical protein
MPPEITYEQDADSRPLVVREQDIETDFLEKLRSLKYIAPTSATAPLLSATSARNSRPSIASA